MRHVFAILLAMLAAAPSAGQGYRPPEHSEEPAPLYSKLNTFEASRAASAATQVERARPAGWALAEHRRLSRALATLSPQRKGVIDAYVVAIGTDSDPVFGREAREAGRVLSRRYAAAGRTVTLAGTDGSAESTLPRGSPDALDAALARVAELMDKNEDVLVFYATGHGAPLGIVYNDGDSGFAITGPARLKTVLDDLGIKNRLLIVSACFSGVFVAPLATPTTAIVTAASADRTSFGCAADNDWTFFGDALINHALRKPQPLAAAVDDARAQIAGWEARGKLTPSQPSVLIGAEAEGWLTPLDKRVPAAATAPVGRPAADLLDKLKR